MGVEFGIDEFSNRLSLRAANRLLAVAITFQSEAKKDYSVGNPAPHQTPAKRGEHPRLRTGNLRGAIALETTDRDRIAREKKVRVGIRLNAEYGYLLRLKGWKGLLDTLARTKAILAAVAAKR